MSRDPHKDYYSRDFRDSRDRRDPRDSRHHVRDERDYRNYDKHRKRTPSREDSRRSRSPKKDLLDDNIMREISKLPEPLEMWAPPNSGAPPPPGTGFVEPLPSYSQNYLPTYSGLYDDFPSMPGPPQPPEWTPMQLPPLPTPPAPAPPAPAPPPPVIEPRATSFEDQVKKEAAIESEMRHQKAALSKQREDYMKKAGILKKELDTLKDQRNELRGDPKRSPSPDTKRFLKENTKLQLEIQNKLKTITNVVDMLNGIIGENAQEIKIDPDEDSNEKPSKRRSRSPSSKFNYVYYDPEMHWCRVCNEFPPTAKDYLNHLHSPQHHKMAAAHMEAPWHSLPPQNEGFPSYPSAPTKRTPIRGLQFFVPSTAWYCKLCDQFIGDLHCASAHLKSISHSKNYHNFVEQNPHWETDWMSDRQKAVEKSRTKPKVEEAPPPPPAPPHYAAHTITFHKDGSYTKTKESPPTVIVVEDDKKKKEKKRKGRKRRKSSSSSSDSDSSSSGSNANSKKKKKKKTAKEEEDDGRLLNEWMSSLHSGRLSSSERRLMESLKQRMQTEGGRPDARNTPDSRNRERESERRRLEDRRRNEETRGNEAARGHEDKRRNEERRGNEERRRDQPRRDRSPEKSKPKKMPFIGKMPVYKSLSKARAEEQKKDDTKKQEDDQKDKKRREEIDAEIQKKVAEFKEKIAKAQEEREKLSAEPIMIAIPPPGVAIPQRATSILGPPPVVVPPPPAAMPNLPKDFQEALDIIFPSDNKAEMQDGLFPAIPGIGGFSFNPFQGMGIMPQMPQMPPQMPPQMSQMPPQMPQLPPNMPPMQQPPMQPHGMPFGMNQQMFPRFDNFQQNSNSNNRQQQNKNKNNKQNYKPFNNSGAKKMNGEKKAKDDQAKKEADAKKSAASKKKIEELDDLAMLGIDASDVGSGM